MKLQPVLLAALLMEASLLPTSAATTTGGYNITAFYGPGGALPYPKAINNAGQIVGYFYGASTIPHGFVYQSGVSTRFDCPNAQSTNPMAISDAGIVYGACGSNIFQYVISSGQLTTSPIQLPPGYSNPSSATITAISPTGEVFGWLSTTSGFQAFEYLYPSGTAAFLTGLPGSTAYLPIIAGANTSGELVGNTNIAFQYLNGVYSQIPQLSSVTGIGPSGQLLGIINGPTAANQGAVYHDGLIALLQLPITVGFAPIPVAMNASGYVVGTYTVGSPGFFAGFLATPDTVPSSEKSSIRIDSPNSTSGTLSGLYQVSGWAIDNNSGIDAINILVDRALAGTTTTTIARPDVCAAFPNQSGCPTVGWQYMLDTTKLADGTHTLETIAISNTGQRAITTASITVANNGQKPNSLKLTIDTPTPQNPVSGQVVISGWAEEPGSYASYVGVTFDLTGTSGIQYTAQTGISRPDVCAALPGDLNCPNVGWSYTLNSSSLTNGPHTVTVLATAANGDQTVVTKTFTVANSGPLKLYLDQPTANSGTLSGQTTISGWAFDPTSHIASVIAAVDGLVNTSMNFGLPRPDVCASLPGGLDCPNVGWSGSLYTTALANGTHTLSIAATAQNGDVLYSQPLSFVVNNPSSGNTTHVDIDTPSAANQQFWAQAPFSGWALDNVSRIKSIDFLIDGNAVPAASYSIVGRPDVCAAFPGSPDCPAVGWSYSLNTLALSNGTHTITVIAISEAESRATASATFTVNNHFAQNITKLNIDSPAAGAAPLSAQATVSGWALSFYDNIASLTASVDAGPVLLPAYHLKRPDVCQVYVDAPDCPNVGWSFGLDTTQLADGVHRLNVTATTAIPNAIGYELTQSVFFTVANSGASSPILSYIDTPTAATPALSGVTSFSGWSIDQTTTIANVEITVDGIPFGLATYGGIRPDVCAGFPQYAGCPAGAVGWSFAIDTTTLINGSHTLAVTAASSDGNYHTITSSFSTAN